MKRKLIFAVAAAVVLFCVGFASYKLLHKEDNTSPEAVPVQEAADELKGYKFGEYDNLRFECEVDEVDIDEVYSDIEIGIYPKDSDLSEVEFKSRAEKGLMILGKQEKSDRLKYNEQDGSYDYTGDDAIYSYYPNGSLLWVDFDMVGSDDGVYADGYARIEKRLSPNEITDDTTYSVGGESYKVKDAVIFADKLFADYGAELLCTEKPRLMQVIVARENESGEYYYLLRYLRSIGGVCCDDSGTVVPELDYLRGGYIDIELRAKDKISYMESFAGFIIKDKATADTIIPLSEAERLSAEKIAPEAEYTVSECALRYVCVSNHADEQDGKKVKMCPFWVFTIECENGSEYRFRDDNFKRRKLYINALTGESMIYQYESGLVISEGEKEYMFRKGYED